MQSISCLIATTPLANPLTNSTTITRTTTPNNILHSRRQSKQTHSNTLCSGLPAIGSGSIWYRDMLVSASARNDEARPKYQNPYEDKSLSGNMSPDTHKDQNIASPPPYSEPLQSISPPAVFQSIPVKPQLYDAIQRPRKPLAVGQVICEMLPNPANPAHSPATSPSFVSLSMSPSHSGLTRIPRSDRLPTLPASLGRSDLAGSHLYIPGAAFLPLVPLLPLPEPNPTIGTRMAAPSQLPTPGAEQDKSTPFFNPSQMSPTKVMHTAPEVVGNSVTGPSIPSHSQYHDTSIRSEMPSSATLCSTLPQCLTVTGPPSPSPSLSDSHARVHPNVLATVDHLQDTRVPGSEPVVQPPNLTHTHSETGQGSSSPVSDHLPLPVPTLDEDRPIPVVATPPRLVVVNPTPGPTPHPTPPATPLSFLATANSARLRPHGQFLAPPSSRMTLQQLAPIPASVFELGSNTPAGGMRGPAPALNSRSRSTTTPSGDSSKSLQETATELRTTASPRIQSTLPTQDPVSVEHALRSRPEASSPRTSTSVTSVKSSKSTVSKTNVRPRRASSGGGGGRSRSRKAGNVSTANRATSNSSDSRSRSRDAVSRKELVAAAGALAATMGMTTTNAAGPSGGARKRMGGKVAGKGRVARTVGRGPAPGGPALKRTLSHEDVEEVTDEAEELRAKQEREKEEAAAREAAISEVEEQVISKAPRAKFKFGSNSDNGSNAGIEIFSHAPGSEMYGGEGYDVKGKGRESDLAAQERHTQELKERELSVQRTREAAAALEKERQAKQDKTRKEAEAVARARAQESLADPLLPQANKRTILLTSESDYTDTDDDSWTSEDAEEGGAVQAPVSRQPPPTARQSSHESRQAHHHAPHHHNYQQHPPHPPAAQRTHSNTTSRREWQHIQQRREAQLRVQRAAAQLQREEEEEKQRQKEMFAKKPTTSFQNLTELQRRSTGLLTQLMNPDPAIFPPNHPYRRGHSSGEIQRMGMTAMTGMTAVAPLGQPQPCRTQSQQPQQPIPNGQLPISPQPPPAPPSERKPVKPIEQYQCENTHRTHVPRCSTTLDSPLPPSKPPVATGTAPDNNTNAAPPSPVRSKRRAPLVTNIAVALALRGMRTLGFGSGKSTTAGPMASQVIAGSVNTKQAAKTLAGPPTTVLCPASSNSYRPKGPQPGQEMDTDSEDEAEDNHLQLSKSVAQDRLKQFAARRGIMPTGPALPTQLENDNEDEIPQWAREPKTQVQGPHAQQATQPAAPLPALGRYP
ncbi:hypothetical protein NMY22_g7125 [Coprinellus aureogranulatus]|nr:hypothetical protein NMY22_g7125 [Coprinellus aureogranulatus]